MPQSNQVLLNNISGSIIKDDASTNSWVFAFDAEVDETIMGNFAWFQESLHLLVMQPPLEDTPDSISELPELHLHRGGLLLCYCCRQLVLGSLYTDTGDVTPA